jgi:DNA-binding beta-propeller fold protein YncE
MSSSLQSTERRRPAGRWRLLACVLAVVGLLGCWASPALASRAHTFEKSFGSAGSGPGQFNHPAGVAVNEATGDLYVLDRGNDRVERFSASGKYLGQFNGSGEYEVEGKKETGTAAGGGGRMGEIPTGKLSFRPPGSEPIEDAAYGDGAVAVDNSCYVRHLSGGSCASEDPSNGDVYVLDEEHKVIDKFSAEGAYIGQVTESVCAEASGCLLDPGGPTASSGAKFAWSATGVSIWGIAVSSATGELLVTQSQPTTLEGGPFEKALVKFDDASENKYVTSVPLKESAGEEASLGRELAVGCGGLTYVGYFTSVESKVGVYDRIQAIGAEGKHSSDSIVPETFADAVAVEQSSCDVYADRGTSVVRLRGRVPWEEIESFGSPQLKLGTGVGVNPSIETVYVADQEADVVDVFGPEPPGAPRVLEESVSGVSAESAKLEASVDPHGASTEYFFEYGRCASSLSSCASSGYEHRVPEPEGQAGAGYEREAVSAQPQGLAAGANYHFRVVAHNGLNMHGAKEEEEVLGKERTFTTEPVGAFALLDGRAYELVSPPAKHGATIFPPSEGQEAVQAAAGGGAFTFLTTAPTESQPQGFTNFTQVLSTRVGGTLPGGTQSPGAGSSSSWESKDIGIPHLEATGQEVGQGMEYRVFSEELSEAIVQPFGGFVPCTSEQGAVQPCLSEAASEQTPFLRTNFDNKALCTSTPTHSCYRPLVTGCPQEGEEEACAPAVRAAEDVPPGTVFGTKGKCPVGQFTCGPHFEGATSDLSHVVISSVAALTETRVKEGLYEWSAGRLQLLSFLPVSEGGHAVAAELGVSAQDSGGRLAGAVSQDGNRVIWTPTDGGALYLRDTEGGEESGETVRLDQVKSGSGKGSSTPLFQGSSSEGSVVFFTDSQRLTDDSGGENPVTHAAEPDLYECETVPSPVTGELECELSDLTPLHGTESANVQGGILGMGEDGASVYFVAQSVLAENANQAGEQAKPHEDNLYVSHEGTPTFIATLSAADSPDWNVSEGSSPKAFRTTARSSPDGQYLAFMSQRQLTGYNNTDLHSGKPDEEVYLYDAAGGESGTLVCASCNPTGERPTGVVPSENSSLTLQSKVWPESVGVAANVPGWTSPFYQSRYLSNGGRLFFNSYDRLVPQDVNGTWDVYEYEPAGYRNREDTVECSAESVAYSERSGGCVGLISSGESPEESGFLDASENGEEVFFMTSAKLAPQDFDSSYDIYDAHECTTSAPCSPEPASTPPACTTESQCRPAPTIQPEVFGAPPSATFSGPGDLAAPGGRAPNPVKPKPKAKPKKCAKGKTRNKHGVCVKKPKRKQTRPKS